MRLLDYGIFFYLLNRMAGGRALAFVLVVTSALFVLAFGSLVGAIANSRTKPSQRWENRAQPMTRKLPQTQPPPLRDWQEVRREQLRQLGLHRQGQSPANR